MSFQARIHDLITGDFLLACQVEATDLHEAEKNAIFHAANALTSNPQNMDVRHLHERAKKPESPASDQLRWSSI
jgi:hypothetical protein